MVRCCQRIFLLFVVFIYEGDQYDFFPIILLSIINICVLSLIYFVLGQVTDAWYSLSCSCSGFLQNFCWQQLQLSTEPVGSQWFSKTEEMLTCWVLSLLALKNRMRHWILLYSLQIWTRYCKVIQQIIICALLQYPLSAIRIFKYTSAVEILIITHHYCYFKNSFPWLPFYLIFCPNSNGS